jgi:FkbH-like protein
VIESLPELTVLTVTDADRTRTRQYVERRQREAIRAASATPAQYLASLGIEVAIRAVSERTVQRVQQLFQRTNQFNLTGHRYDHAALAARAQQHDARIYVVDVRDRFGDHGLVATAVASIESEVWTIDNLVMSCRVIGYGIEDALLARIAADAHAVNARWLVGEFVPTPKNAPARDFYARSGFERDALEGERELWRRLLTRDALTVPAWITVAAGDDA